MFKTIIAVCVLVFVTTLAILIIRIIDFRKSENDVEDEFDYIIKESLLSDLLGLRRAVEANDTQYLTKVISEDEYLRIKDELAIAITAYEEMILVKGE